jgi:hypothetical protein
VDERVALRGAYKLLSVAAQPVAGADQAIESVFDVCIAFEAFRSVFGHTAAAAWRLSSNPLGRQNL